MLLLKSKNPNRPFVYKIDNAIKGVSYELFDYINFVAFLHQEIPLKDYSSDISFVKDDFSKYYSEKKLFSLTDNVSAIAGGLLLRTESWLKAWSEKSNFLEKRIPQINYLENMTINLYQKNISSLLDKKFLEDILNEAYNIKRTFP